MQVFLGRFRGEGTARAWYFKAASLYRHAYFLFISASYGFYILPLYINVLLLYNSNMKKSQLTTIIADQSRELLEVSTDDLTRIADISRHLKMPEVSVITGVRRCGKSTLLRQIAQQLHPNFNIHYLNFEDQRLTQFQVGDFQVAYEEFLIQAKKKEKQILIYDEIQLVEGWERWVAGLAAKKQIKVFITGSNSKLLSSELSSLLTGRHISLHMTPLSFQELASSYKDLALDTQQESTETKIALCKLQQEYFQYGGFPRAFISKDIGILGQYYQDITQRDIALRRKVRNVSALTHLGVILASQNGRLTNESAIARELNVRSVITIGKFCDYFKETLHSAPAECKFCATGKQFGEC